LSGERFLINHRNLSQKPPKAQEISGWESLNAQAKRTDTTFKKLIFERSLLERGGSLKPSTEGATKLLI
jgi:hypothetical protein